MVSALQGVVNGGGDSTHCNPVRCPCLNLRFLPGSLPTVWRTVTRKIEGWPLLRLGAVLPALHRHFLLLQCFVPGCQELNCRPKGCLAELAVVLLVVCGLMLHGWGVPRDLVVVGLETWCQPQASQCPLGSGCIDLHAAIGQYHRSHKSMCRSWAMISGAPALLPPPMLVAHVRHEAVVRVPNICLRVYAALGVSQEHYWLLRWSSHTGIDTEAPVASTDCVVWMFTSCNL